MKRDPNAPPSAALTISVAFKHADEVLAGLPALIGAARAVGARGTWMRFETLAPKDLAAELLEAEWRSQARPA